MTKELTLIQKLLYRANEIESFDEEVDFVPPSGRDTYTASLLREAARELSGEGTPDGEE